MAEKTDIPKPPKHLRPATKRWWSSVLNEYSLESHHLKLLVRAAEAWDRGEQAREAIAEHGLVYTDRFGAPRARPEVSVERDSRIGFARLLRELALDGVDAPSAPRMARTARLRGETLMPVRKRADKRAGRADFPVSAELLAAFNNYIASDPVEPISCWPDYWHLADLLKEAGAPVEPLLGILCFHPKDERRLMGGEMALYRRLAAG